MEALKSLYSVSPVELGSDLLGRVRTTVHNSEHCSVVLVSQPHGENASLLVESVEEITRKPSYEDVIRVKAERKNRQAIQKSQAKVLVVCGASRADSRSAHIT